LQQAKAAADGLLLMMVQMAQRLHHQLAALMLLSLHSGAELHPQGQEAVCPVLTCWPLDL
jgi:hypothetical protein